MGLYTVSHLPPEYLQVIDLILELRKRLRFALSDERHRWTGILRRSTFAKAIQGSNSIEGYNVNYNDAVAAVDGEEPVDAKDKEWANIVGYRQALTYVLQLSCEPGLRVEEGTLRALHFMMLSHDMQSHPGIWRRGAIFVRRDPEGSVVYEGPDAQMLPALIGEFVDCINDKNDLPLMVRAALAHLNLVMIHPFSDGNGRMGRALQAFLLARDKVVDPVFSSIEEWLGGNTQSYYNVLGEVGRGSWNPQNDPLPFIKFCLVAHFQQAEELLRQEMFFNAIWERIETAAKEWKIMERMCCALADASIGIRVRNSGYRNQVGISNESASKDFKVLVEKGLLLPKGERKGRYYEASEALEKLMVGALPPKTTRDPFELIAKSAGDVRQQALPGFARGQQ